MTPKEKAQDLFKKFHYQLPRDLRHRYLHSIPCRCALILVDEIIDAIDWDAYEGSAQTEYNYWREVEQEIENL